MAAGNITMVVSAEMGGFINTMVGVADKVANVEGGITKLAAAANRAVGEIAKTGEAGEKAGGGVGVVGSAMLGLTGKLMSLVGPGALLAAFVSMLKETRDAARESAASLIEEAKARAGLVLVGGPVGKEQTSRNIALAELAGIEAGKPMTGMVAKAKAFGMTDADVLDVARSQRFLGEGGPEGMAEIVGQLQAPAAFGKGAGTAQQIMSAIIKAAGPTGKRPEEFGALAMKAVAPTIGIGGTLDEMLSLVSTLSPGFGGPEQAAAAVRTLALRVGKEGYGGRGLMAGLEAWQAKAPSELEAALGGLAPAAGPGGPALKGERRGRAIGEEPGIDEELAGGRTALAWQTIQRTRDLIAQRTKEVAQARLTGAGYEAALGAADVPELTVPQKARRAAAQLVFAREPLGQAELRLQTAQDERRALQFQEGGMSSLPSRIRTKMDDWGDSIVALVAGPDAARKQTQKSAFEAAQQRLGIPFVGPEEQLQAYTNPEFMQRVIDEALRRQIAPLRGEVGGPALRGDTRDEVLQSIEQNTRRGYGGLRPVRADDRE